MSGASPLSFLPLPHSRGQMHALKHMERLRITSNVFVIAAVVMVAATIVLIGLSQARYLLPTYPLFTVGGTVFLILVGVAVDQCRKSIGRKHGIDPDDHIRETQPIPAKEKKKDDIT